MYGFSVQLPSLARTSGGCTSISLIINALAVFFGAGVAAWMPERVTAAILALLFGGFGVHALHTQEKDKS